MTKLYRRGPRYYEVRVNDRLEGTVRWDATGGHGGAHWLAESSLIDGPRYYHTRADAVRKIVSP